MSLETEPGLWKSVRSVALGQRRQSGSRHFSPPRMPVSQSWTRVTREVKCASMRRPPRLWSLAGGHGLHQSGVPSAARRRLDRAAERSQVALVGLADFVEGGDLIGFQLG